ncbi:Retinol dehydrogenase 8 [Boothiomyces sp. JEL0866]|nr:Retinol dehydrogenase 8 [Boothiomyces sp. JEL0866]
MLNVLVTGVTAGGLGASIAIKLAKSEKYKVFGTLRNLSKSQAFLDQLKSETSNSVTLVQLDVTSQQSCNDAIAKIGKVDVLINNAGQGLVQTIEGTDIDKIIDCFQVNYFGVYRLIKTVLPSMRQNKYGRIVNIASVGGLVGQPFNEGYCSAKAALDSLTESMNSTLRTFNIKTASFCPGLITTNFINNADGLDKETIPGMPEDFNDMFSRYIARTKNLSTNPQMAPYRQTADQCAQDVVDIVEQDLPKARVYTKTVAPVVEMKFGDASSEKVIEYLRTMFK